MVRAGQSRGGPNAIERQHNLEPALGRLVKVATGVRDKLTTHAGGAVDCRGIAIERIQIDGRPTVEQRRPGGAINLQDIIDGFHHKAVARAHALVGRLNRKLVAAVCQTLLAQVQPIEARSKLRVRLGLLTPVGISSLAWTLIVTAVNNRARERRFPLVVVNAGNFRKYRIACATGC